MSALADRGNDAYKFLLDNGVEFEKGAVAHFGGHSVPRTLLTANHSGSGFIQPMVERFEKLEGCELRRRAKFDDFIVDDSGRVVGVVMREEYKFDDKLYSDDLENTSGVKKIIKAKKGVVLAAGGFCRDRIFRKMQDPRIPDDVDSTNHAGATAGVLLKAFELGAYPVQVDWIQFGPWASPDERGFGAAPMLNQEGNFKFGFAVDVRTGKRFMNELADRKTRADAEFRILREDPTAYPISIGYEGSFRQVNPSVVEKGMASGKLVTVCKDLDEVAAKFKVPATALKETFKKYNEGIKAGKDEFGKPVDQLNGEIVKETGPYYVIRLSPKPHHTMGGLKINEKAQVLSAKNNKPIAGLYAAGEITGGTHGASRLGSVAVTDCIIFGMIAGEQI